jgi:hypothetical protein
VPFPSQSTGSYAASLPDSTQKRIADVVRTVAANNNRPLVDLQPLIGTGDAAAAAGLMFDQLQPNDAGYPAKTGYIDQKLAMMVA